MIVKQMLNCAALVFLAAATAQPVWAQSSADDASGNRPILLQGAFGQAKVDVTSPALVELILGAGDRRGGKSILAQNGPSPWARGGYTYVVGKDGTRYESRTAEPERVQASQVDGRTAVHLRGIKLTAKGQLDPVAIEDWTLSVPGDGSQLVWKIQRQWERDFTSKLSGSPGLFFSFDNTHTNNSVTNTVWYDPLRLIGRPSSDDGKGWFPRPRALSKNLHQIVRDRDTWAIYKLWTNWHAPTDLRIEVEGGHLFRRGAYAFSGEAGAVTSTAPMLKHRKGESEVITVKIGGVDKHAAGHHLLVDIPDKELEGSLKDFYGSLLNGGTICDQKGFDYGNESDGYHYSGSTWAQAIALAAGMPTTGQLSSHPYDAVSAFREHLAHIFSMVADDGRDQFGYNHVGLYHDCGLMAIIATHTFLVQSGDLPFVTQHLPTLERMLEFFVKRRNAAGLYVLDPTGYHWYYDGVHTSGVNTYYNAQFYKAATDLAEMELAAGRKEKADEYRQLAESIRTAANRVLWRENTPGGPRYLDFIAASGTEVAYFCDLCQWSAVAYGLASPDQARKIIATADARIVELERDHGYHAAASLSALWPIPEEFFHAKFGTDYNGGHGLSPTYWEIVARARSGDTAGALRRLKRFSEQATQASWVGNWFTMTGKIESAEAYLADMVVVPAALHHGILGIDANWQELQVTPHLPPDWKKAEANVLYKGRRHRIRLQNGKPHIEADEQIAPAPLLWVMDSNMQTLGPGRKATGSAVDFGDGGAIQLARENDNRACLGLWKFDEAVGPAIDSGAYGKHGAVQGEGIKRSEPGRNSEGKCFRFEGTGWVAIGGDGGFAVGPYTPHNDCLMFSPWESFTLQAWFKTDSKDTQVILRSLYDYEFGVRDGKLFAWIMQDAGQRKEAVGRRQIADGKWHHAAAVIDRSTQRMSLYVDGKLDVADGQSQGDNPADISLIRASKWGASVSLGGIPMKPSWKGCLDEVSIFAGALRPEEFAIESDYSSPYGGSEIVHMKTGSYQSPNYDWTVPAKLEELVVVAELNGGQVVATLETSNDGFETVQSKKKIDVKDGVNAYAIDGPVRVAHAVRVRFDLTRGADPAATPVIDAYRIRAEQATSNK